MVVVVVAGTAAAGARALGIVEEEAELGAGAGVKEDVGMDAEGVPTTVGEDRREAEGTGSEGTGLF